MQKVKMISTTNPIFQYLCTTIDLSKFTQDNRIFRFGNFHTSYIKECTIKDSIMTLRTRNSEYTFELLDGTSYTEFKRTPEEILEMEKLCK